MNDPFASRNQFKKKLKDEKTLILADVMLVDCINQFCFMKYEEKQTSFFLMHILSLANLF